MIWGTPSHGMEISDFMGFFMGFDGISWDLMMDVFTNNVAASYGKKWMFLHWNLVSHRFWSIRIHSNGEESWWISLGIMEIWLLVFCGAPGPSGWVMGVDETCGVFAGFNRNFGNQQALCTWRASCRQVLYCELSEVDAEDDCFSGQVASGWAEGFHFSISLEVLVGSHHWDASENKSVKMEAAEVVGDP